VKKLIHCKTQRLLDIIGYSTTESDVRRLEYAIQQFGEQDKVFKKRDSVGMDSMIGGSMAGFFGVGADKLEDKIMQLGVGLPKLDSDLKMMQIEM